MHAGDCACVVYACARGTFMCVRVYACVRKRAVLLFVIYALEYLQIGDSLLKSFKGSALMPSANQMLALHNCFHKVSALHTIARWIVRT